MPRPLWKGSFLTNLVYLSAIAEKQSKNVTANNFNINNKLYKRNVYLDESIFPFVVDKEFKIYNGYDFIPRVIIPDLLKTNLSTLVNTRETNVFHKAKQSKHQKRNAATQGAKKKLINVSKSKVKTKNKVKFNKKN